MHFYIKNILIFSVLFFLISACAPLRDQEASQYESVEESALEELKKTYEALDTIQSIDIALNVHRDDLSSLVNMNFKDFSQYFCGLHSGEFSNVVLGHLEFTLSGQQISSKLDFSFQVDALQGKIFGHVKAKHEFQAGRDQFIMGTNFDEIIIERVEQVEDNIKSNENRHLIASSVKSFMKALNTEIRNFPLSMPVDMNFLKGINEQEIIRSADYKLHSATPIHILTKMRKYIPYIHNNGIVFFGASELKKSPENLVLSSIGPRLWSDLDDKISSLLDKSMGVSLEAIKEHSSCYVSKVYLSKQMNTALSNIDLRSIKKYFFTLDQKDHSFSKEVVLRDKNLLPLCDEVKKDCSKSLQECTRGCDDHYGFHRCEDCSTLNPFEKVRCVSRQEACRTKEELLLYECKRDENRCNDKNDHVLSECQAENRLLVSQCSEKKKSLILSYDAITLAKLRLDVEVVNSYVIQHTKGMMFDQHLDTIEVDKEFDANVDSRIGFEVSKSSHSDIACSLQRREPLFTHSFSNHLRQKVKVSLSVEACDDGTLTIKGKNRIQNMPIQLNATPYDNLIKDDIFVLDCHYLNIPMPSIPQTELLDKSDIPSELTVMLGRTELRFEDEEISFRISPVSVNHTMVLFPHMLTRSISFKKER